MFQLPYLCGVKTVRCTVCGRRKSGVIILVSHGKMLTGKTPRLPYCWQHLRRLVEGIQAMNTYLSAVAKEGLSLEEPEAAEKSANDEIPF